MYAAKMKGHLYGGCTMDGNIVNDLAAVWQRYFPGEEFSVSDHKVLLAADLVDSFLESNLLSRVEDDSSGISYVPIDFQELKRLCGFIETELQESPKEALLYMGAAAHLAVCSLKKSKLSNINKINIRLYNYSEKTIALKELKAAYIKKMVAVCGTVLKVSTVKPLVVQLKFRCMKCGTEITRVFCDGKFSPPVSCDISGCKSRTFTPERSTAKLIDFQKIRIQEFCSADNHEEGRVPRTVECELTEDLVDCCIPGQVVTVTGIVKVLNNYMDVGGGKSKNRSKGLYYLYLEAISLRNLKSHAEAIPVKKLKPHTVSDEETRASGNFEFQNCTERDLEFVVNYKQEHGADVFRQLLQSFCPSIYGHELVKAGITLALFGGVQKNSMNRNKVPVRGDIHVVVVGDPGLGKSQLLQAAAAVSPRGIYVCGNTTTRAGLTVAVVKDPMTNDFAFEAGAMVLADGGLCCVDEFDKMSAEHQALLEAMEQQCVSVAKAGLVASLSARASVLAAANPVGGHYDRSKTVNENLKMNAALLSRFDLVFILLDKPDELLDKRVSDHIIALHSNDGDHFKSSKRTKTVSQCDAALGFEVGKHSFASRLRLHPERDKNFVPLEGPLIRKYITYAREHVYPRLSRGAADILQDFYLKLRKRSIYADGTPITARQLESLVRLAEARARVDLREEVTVNDAQDVIEIMKESLYEKYVDEHGFVDFARSGGMSQQKAAKKLLSALYKESESERKDCFSRTLEDDLLGGVKCYGQPVGSCRTTVPAPQEEISILADRIMLLVPNLDTVIDSLRNEGCLLYKGSGMYQVVAASYSQCHPARSR